MRSLMHRHCTQMPIFKPLQRQTRSPTVAFYLGATSLSYKSSDHGLTRTSTLYPLPYHVKTPQLCIQGSVQSHVTRNSTKFSHNVYSEDSATIWPIEMTLLPLVSCCHRKWSLLFICSICMFDQAGKHDSSIKYGYSGNIEDPSWTTNAHFELHIGQYAMYGHPSFQ